MAMWYERRYTANMKGVIPNKFLLEEGKEGRRGGEEERGGKEGCLIRFHCIPIRPVYKFKRVSALGSTNITFLW